VLPPNNRINLTRSRWRTMETARRAGYADHVVQNGRYVIAVSHRILALAIASGLVLAMVPGCQSKPLAQRPAAGSRIQRVDFGGLAVSLETTAHPHLAAPSVVSAIGGDRGRAGNSYTSAIVAKPAAGTRFLTLVAIARNSTADTITLDGYTAPSVSDSKGHRMRDIFFDAAFVDVDDNLPRASSGLRPDAIAPNGYISVIGRWQVPAAGAEFTFRWSLEPRDVAVFLVR